MTLSRKSCPELRCAKLYWEYNLSHCDPLPLPGGPITHTIGLPLIEELSDSTIFNIVLSKLHLQIYRKTSELLCKIYGFICKDNLLNFGLNVASDRFKSYLRRKKFLEVTEIVHSNKKLSTRSIYVIFVVFTYPIISFMHVTKYWMFILGVDILCVK